MPVRASAAGTGGARRLDDDVAEVLDRAVDDAGGSRLHEQAAEPRGLDGAGENGKLRVIGQPLAEQLVARSASDHVDLRRRFAAQRADLGDRLGERLGERLDDRARSPRPDRPERADRARRTMRRYGTACRQAAGNPSSTSNTGTSAGAASASARSVRMSADSPSCSQQRWVSLRIHRPMPLRIVRNRSSTPRSFVTPAASACDVRTGRGVRRRPVPRCRTR